MRYDLLTEISFSKLFKKLLNFREGIFQVIVLYLLWSAIELSIPFLFKLLIDQGLGFKDIRFVYLILAAQLLLFIVNIFADFFKAWLLRHIGVRINLDVMNSYYTKVIRKSVLFFNKHQESVLLQHFTDNIRIDKFLTEGIMNGFNAVFKIILFSIILLLFDGWIALIFFLSACLLLVYILVFSELRKNQDKIVFQTNSELRSEMIELSRGIYDIKTNRLEKTRIKRWHDLQDRVMSARFRVLNVAHYYKGGVYFISQSRDILILGLACYSVLYFDMTIGTLLAIQYILSRATAPSMDAIKAFQESQDATLSMKRLQTIFDGKDVPDESEEDSMIDRKDDITIKNLTYYYDQQNGIEDLNFKIPYGLKIAIVGESGSGKSTLIKIIAKLMETQNGEILVGNTPLHEISESDWYRHISLVAQEGFLFNGTVEDNIAMGRPGEDLDQERMRMAIEQSCLVEIMTKKEHGIKTAIEKHGQNFSRGQMQRILLARAIYKNSNYYIFDEPTSALDNITSAKVLDNILNLFADRTVIIASHKMHLTRLMDFIVLMDDGRIIEMGSPKELLSNKNSYFDLYYSRSN